MAHFDLQIFAADGHLLFDTKILAEGFSAGISKLGSIAKGGLAVLGGAVAGVTGAMGAGIAAGMKYNADMQTYMANFSTMLGSQEAALQFVDSLKETAAKTPFEMADLADASKILLAFGSTADNANDQIKMLGDISLGNAEKMKTLSTAFGRIQSNGRASMEEINMMIDSGFNPLNIIAEKTGESMDELRKRVSAGGVSFEEVSEAMQVATSAGGQFYQGMEKASQTFEGLVSTLKDNAMALLGEVVEPLTQDMTERLLPAAIEAIDQLSAAFQADGLEGLISAGASVAANLITGMVEQLPSLIETAIGFLDMLIQALDANMPQLVIAGGRLLAALGQGILQLASTLLPIGLNLIQSLAASITSAAPQLIPAAASAVLKFAQGIVNNLPSLLNTGLKILESVAKGIANAFPTIIEQGPKLINSFADAVYGAFPKILAAGGRILATLGKGLIDSIPTIIANAGEIVEAIINVFSLVNLAKLGKNIIKSLGSGLKSAGEFIKNIGKQIVEMMKHPFDPSGWIAIGKNIIDGIANGIRGAMSKVVNAAKSVVKSALGAVKDFLGIHSPSRVFHDEVGKNIALGIGDGIRANKDYAKKSAEEIAQLTLDAAKKKLENHKVYNALSLADEVAYWDSVRAQVKEGTQARIDVDKEYLAAKKDLNDRMVQAEKNYTDQIAQAYENLDKEIRALNSQYEEAVSQRADQISSAFGLFDSFDTSTELTSDDLFDNLQSQVDGLKEWRRNLQDLEWRGISDELLAELEGLGPQAAAEIALLTDMTDDQLAEYSDLFHEKNLIARKQAVDEMEPMRRQISAQIAELQRETAADLAKYQEEYIQAMESLGVSLNQPLETMKLNAAQNAVALVTAMADTVKEVSGSSENQDKFKAIAENVLNATNSLPTSMSDLGVQAINSLIAGMTSMTGKLQEEVRNLVNTAVSGAVSELMDGSSIDQALRAVNDATGTTELPAALYGREGEGPGSEVDYKRIGQETANAMRGMAVNMDGSRVGKVVAEPVDAELGSQGKIGERDGR